MNRSPLLLYPGAWRFRCQFRDTPPAITTTPSMSFARYRSTTRMDDDSGTPASGAPQEDITMQAVHPTYRHRLIAIESAERLTQLQRAHDARAAGYRQRPVRVVAHGRRLVLAFGAAVTLPGLLSLLS